MTPLKPTTPQQDALDFIEELGYRFPDMAPQEVMAVYQDYIGTGLTPGCALHDKVLGAYNRGARRILTV